MIDLTLNEKDRDEFITNLYLKDGDSKYVVKHASGRIVEENFSIHNFNQRLYKMEEQYLQFREEYVKNNLKLQGKVQARKLIEALIAILGVFLSVNLPLPEIIQGIIVCLLSIYTFLYQVAYSKIINYSRTNVEVVRIADRFLEMKDKFRISITDPKSGQEEEWYLFSLSGIEQLYGIEELNFLSEYITDDVKNSEREITENVLKRVMSM